MTGTCLLDVNVLVALAWPAHSSHTIARNWFAHRNAGTWATSAITQAGLVRTLAGPGLGDARYSLQDAMRLLETAVHDVAHEFWPDDVSLAEALAPCVAGVRAYRQLTDAYLLGLALHHHGKLVTLDRGIRHLLPRDSPLQAAIVTLG